MKFFSDVLQKDCIKAVLFDIFGTVVDWRGTMVKEFRDFFSQKGIIDVNCEEFVEIWVNAYSKNMREISEGNRSFTLVDELNIIALTETLLKYNIADKFTDEETKQMWMVWHRLEPWPDSVFGITKLKKQFKIGTLSNGNIKLLEDLSKNAKLEWNVILSGEHFRCYKPNPLVYQNAAIELKMEPSEILLVASHKYDLKAAQECGYKTAYIFRPDEFRTVEAEQEPMDHEFDFVINSIDELAETLKKVVLEQSEELGTAHCLISSSSDLSC